MAKTRPDQPQIQVVETQQQVAEFFKVSRQTVKSNWIPRGMPGRPKCYDLSAIAAWRTLDLARQSARRPPLSGGEQLIRALEDASRALGRAARLLAAGEQLPISESNASDSPNHTPEVKQ